MRLSSGWRHRQSWIILMVTGLNVTINCQSHVDVMCAIINQVRHSKTAKSIKTKPIWIISCLGHQMVYGCPRRSNVALHVKQSGKCPFQDKNTILVCNTTTQTHKHITSLLLFIWQTAEIVSLFQCTVYCIYTLINQHILIDNHFFLIFTYYSLQI